MSLSRKSLLVLALGMALAACGGTALPEQGDRAVASAAADGGAVAGQPTAAPAERGDEAAPASPEDAGFDIRSAPVSDVALGDFPYLRLPAGYVYQGEDASDDERIPFWTGDRIEWVEGRLFGGRIIGDKAQGKEFSLLEYQRNMQAAIRQAGGHGIAQGRIPTEFHEAVEEADPGLEARLYSAMGNTFGEPVETFVIRRADRDIWIQVGGYANGGNLRVVETGPLGITAGLLDASGLKRQSRADGRVARDVRSAIDSADIPADCQPPPEQVRALLRESPAPR